MVAVLVLALAGCGKKDKLDQALSDFEGWKDKVCACKDAACAEKEFEGYKAWEDKMEKELGDVDKEKNKEKLEKFEAVEKEMKACRRKFREAEAPAAPTP